MNIVDRFELICRNNEWDILESKNGSYVQYSDYESLRKQLAECQKDAERWRYYVEFGMPWINSGETPTSTIDRAMGEKG